jgi:hypothetical protein
MKISTLLQHIQHRVFQRNDTEAKLPKEWHVITMDIHFTMCLTMCKVCNNSVLMMIVIALWQIHTKCVAKTTILCLYKGYNCCRQMVQ